jgi:hypothetical protein
MDNIKASGDNNQNRWWLFVININTRFLIAEPLPLNKEASFEIITGLLRKIQNNLPEDQRIKFLRSDAGRYFGTVVDESHRGYHEQIGSSLIARTKRSEPFIDFLKEQGIEPHINKHPYTNRSRIVDRAARTIRDMLGENPYRMLIVDDTFGAIDVYNNTPHGAFNYQFTPAEVQSNKYIEEYFIREQLYKLEEVKNKQAEAGFFQYIPGDILLVHRENSKSGVGVVHKNRRVFNCIARFNRYEHGNVECSVYKRGARGISEVSKDPIVVPIFYTRLIAHNIGGLPRDYFTLII